MSAFWALAGLAFISVMVYDATKPGSLAPQEVGAGGNTVVSIFNDITGK